MKKWYVKDLSKVTGVTVQTLHYYDRIGLLKPSVRLDTGYRVYSENDLVNLQQILALKHFGFGLQEISTMSGDILNNFINQKLILKEKEAKLHNAISTLDILINEFNKHQTVDWQNILTLLEDYKMLSEHNYQILLDYEEALHSILTTEELNQYFHLKNSKFANTDEYKAYTQE